MHECDKYIGMKANAHMKIGSNSHEKVKTFKYLGSSLTDKTGIHEEMKCECESNADPCLKLGVWTPTLLEELRL